MKTKTHFTFRVDIWNDTGNSIVEHVAGVDDFEVAEAEPFLSLIGTIERNGEHIVLTLYWSRAGRERGLIGLVALIGLIWWVSRSRG